MTRPSNKVESSEAKVSKCFVKPAEYNGETFCTPEIPDEAQPVKLHCKNLEVVVDPTVLVEIESCSNDMKFVANKAFVPYPDADGTASKSFSNDSLARDSSREHSIVFVYSEPHSPSNASYNRDSSDVSLADTDIIKRRKRRKRRHKRLRFSRREFEHQPNCNNSWRVNKLMFR